MANTGNNNPGNFANDKQKASEAGQKGGQANSGTTREQNTGTNQQQRDQGQKSGQGQGSGGNFANDREKASQAGQKGGQNSHGTDRK